jgi:hypothetical protein
MPWFGSFIVDHPFPPAMVAIPFRLARRDVDRQTSDPAVLRRALMRAFRAGGAMVAVAIHRHATVAQLVEDIHRENGQGSGFLARSKSAMAGHHEWFFAMTPIAFDI